MAIYDRVCRTCGVSFRGGPRAWYCPDCRRERERERKKHYNSSGFARHIGQIDICLNCGKEYTVDAERSAKRRKHYVENKDELNRKRREKYAEKKKAPSED